TMFPTEQVKDDAALKVFSDLRSKYSGSDEAEIAGYYVGGIQAGQGKLADAEKTLREVAEKGNEQYASLAKLSLAEVYFAQGKVDQGRKIFEDLIAHPTLFVSKDQAQIGLPARCCRCGPRRRARSWSLSRILQAPRPKSLSSCTAT